MSKYYHLLLAVAKRIGLIGSLYILSLVYCIDLPDDPDNPSNSDVEISLESSGGLISEQLIIDTVGEEIKISVIQRLPSYIKNTNLQIQTLEGTMEWDTTLFTGSKEYCDTIEIVKRIMIAGDKKVIATVFIDNNTIRADTVLANIINRAVPGNEPSAPEHLRITSRSGDSITLKWDVVSNTNFYTLYRSTAATSGFAVFKDSLTAVQQTIAVEDNLWFFNVIATNTFGKSGPSNTVSSADTGNVPPQWDVTDTLAIQLTAGTQYNLKLNDTCFDSNGDILTYSLQNGNPLRDTINNSIYSYTAIIADTGTSIVKIIVKDPENLSDTLYIKLMVTATANVNHAPQWNTDTLKVSIVDTTTFKVSLTENCTDQDNDSLAYSFLLRLPKGDTILGNVYIFKATADLIGTHFVRIAARDTKNTADTIVIKMSIEPSAVTGATLSSVTLSAGTLQQQNAPVPDTIRDTVSYIDSSVIITPVSRDTLATIMVNGKKVISGKPSDKIILTEGKNDVTITVTIGSASKTCTIIVTRKPNSTITLTTPPEGVTASALSASSVKVSWNSLLGANSYTVQRSISETGTFTTTGTTGSNSFIDTGLTAGTRYFYRVNASNFTNSTGYSASANATTWIKLSIKSQTHDTAVQVGSTVILKIEVTGTDPQFVWSKDNAVISIQPGSGTLSLTGVSTGDAGIYSVKVRNTSDSVVSTPIRLRVLPKTPAVPVVTVRSATSCNVSWNAVDGALWYKVVRSYNSGNFASICSTSQTSMVDTPLVAGGNYSYRLIAGNNDGLSDTSSLATATTWTGPAISLQPQPVTVAAGQAISLSVTATGNPACTYQWQQNGAVLSGKTSTALSINPATLADSGIYRVVITNDVRSITSNEVKVTVLPVYTLTVTCLPTAGGSVNRSKDTTVYISGTPVTLTANPAMGYRFNGWSDDTTVSGTSLSITMKRNRAITANFKRQYALTLISSDAAKGSVSSPSGSSPITVDSGSAITINATPVSGFKFKQWSVTTGQGTIENATLASTTVQLTQGNATVRGVFGCVTFVKKIEQPIVSGNVQVAQWDDGSYFIAGKQWNNGSMITFAEVDKMDVNGSIVWAKTYGLSDVENVFTSIRKTTDGFILACTSDLSFKLWKIVPSGTEIFWLSYNIKGVPAFAQKTSDGGFIIGGENSEMFTPYILKSDLSGNIAWADSSNFCESGYHIYDGQQTSDGGFVYVGADMPLNLFVVKKNNAGAVAWCQHIAGEFEGRTIRETSDGGFITGSIDGTKCVLIKLNSSGNVVWKSENSSVERIIAVRQTSDGGFVYAGSTRLIGTGGYDFCLTKTNSTGVVSWTHTFGSSGADEIASSMETTIDGGFIIVGSGGGLYVVKTDENGIVDP
jgi:fibronectin type 3 domain-containing protein